VTGEESMSGGRCLSSMRERFASGAPTPASRPPVRAKTRKVRAGAVSGFTLQTSWILPIRGSSGSAGPTASGLGDDARCGAGSAP
jgi:hypothetical protein